MDLRKIIAGLVWLLGLSGWDGAYIAAHGVDITALIVGVVSFFPIWVFFDKRIHLNVLGQGFVIGAEEVGKARAELAEAAPEAVKHIQEELPRIQEATEERARLQPAEEKVLQNDANLALVTDPPFSERLSWNPAEGSRAFLRIAEEYAGRSWNMVDPNLALVNLRIEIERRLTRICDLVDIEAHRPTPLSRMVKDLTRIGVFNTQFARVLSEFISFGNQAAHGAVVDAKAASDVLESQYVVLNTLDEIIETIKRQRGMQGGDDANAGS